MPEQISILAVDDSLATLEVIERNLTDAGYRTHTRTSVEQAVAFLEQHQVDLVITDYRMPQSTGLDLVKHVHDNLPDTRIMMITGYPSVTGAVEAIRDGAGEYLSKPFTSEELLCAVERMLEELHQSRAAKAAEETKHAFGIIGESPGMQTVFKRIEKATTTDANVLISGESGTGKELVARAVHYYSERRASPFVPVNCTAIPESLLESELFGHVKGAFTGAKESRAGFFEIANGGTIFLDEIGDASLNLQAKLLRVIQSKEFNMVGSSRIRTVDTRIVAATHKNLPQLVEQGLFREDLFYRINIIDIPVPPLCERDDDVLLLLNQFTHQFAREMNRPVPEFSDAALRTLRNYSWPGNVRELENLVQRLMIIVDRDNIEVTDLPESMRFNIRPARTDVRTLAEVEGEHIRNVLTMANNNKTRAASILGIDRKTLRRKLQRMTESKQ